MKLLILSFYFPPDLSAGSFRTEALCNEIAKNYPNVYVDVLTTKPNRYPSFSKTALDEERYKNINITRFNLTSHSGSLYGQILAFLHFSVKVYKATHKQEYDLVFATSSRLMTASLGAFISKKVRATLYLDIRDLFLDTLLSLYSLKAKIFLLPFLSIIEKYTFSRADKINLVSEGFEDYVKKKYPQKDLSFFTNGIDDVFLTPFTPENIKPSGNSEPDHVTNVLYAGNIGEGQVIDKILPDLSNILGSQYKFFIIGDGSRKKKLEHLISYKGLKNIILLDPVSRDELIKLYKDADVLFLHLDNNLAFKKVLPSKIFEYAATGKPILAGISGYSEIFARKYINNLEVFSPCNSIAARDALKLLELSYQYRDEFVSTFSRSMIMQILAKDIFSLVDIDTYDKNNNV